MDLPLFEMNAANLAKITSDPSQQNLVMRGKTADNGLWIACAGNETGFSTLVAPTSGYTEDTVITTDTAPVLRADGELEQFEIAALSPYFLSLLKVRAGYASHRIRRHECASTVKVGVNAATSVQQGLFVELIINRRDGAVQGARLGGTALTLFKA